MARLEVTEHPTILIADDEDIVRTICADALENAGFRVVCAADGREAMQKLTDEVTVAVLDLSMPRQGGMECLEQIRKTRPWIETIVFTGSQQIRDAIAAMKGGAFDYLVKPADMDQLVEVVKRAAETAGLRRENRELRAAITTPKTNLSFLGSSAAANKVRHLIAKVAPLDSTVLITGESGVGKGLVARLVHAQGPRATGPFLGVSCTALPRDLVEAELFGHEKGAFTGAHERRPGRLEMASGGTLLLDEIGDMPIDLQPKLLTFLQERSFQRIGGSKVLEADVRIIAATHQDLRALCSQRQFREDLFFRLNVLPIPIPPLRSRKEDIGPLIDAFLPQIAARQGRAVPGLSQDALRLLEDYNWPGNVRELENILERTIAFMEGQTITPADLPQEVRSGPPSSGSPHADIAGVALEDLERIAIQQTLELCGNNKSKAAKTLGISEKSIYNKMKRLGLS